MIGTNPIRQRGTAALLPKGEVAVALARLRDGFGQLGELDQRRLASKLKTLADRYTPRQPRPAA